MFANVILRWFIFLLALVLLGAVVWSLIYHVSPMEAGKIAVIIFLILFIMVWLIIRNRSLRKPPPPPPPPPPA